MYKVAKKFPTIISAALVAALGFSASVMAQPPEGGWHHHGHHGGAFGHELRELSLSDQQKASIKQILQAERPQMHAQKAALRAQRTAFEAIVPGSSGYQAAADSLAQAQAAAASARVEAGASVRAQIYALLTDAQKAQLEIGRAHV